MTPLRYHFGMSNHRLQPLRDVSLFLVLYFVLKIKFLKPTRLCSEKEIVLRHFKTPRGRFTPSVRYSYTKHIKRS